MSRSPDEWEQQSFPWVEQLRLWAVVLWLTVCLPLALGAGCATMTKDTARVLLVATAAVRTSVDALATADAIVQPACQTKACLDTWRGKRTKALEALEALHAATKAVGTELTR